MSTKSKNVIEPTNKAVVTFDAEAMAATDDYDNMGRADVAVPFLKVLQALSPECTPGDAEYNESARPGMIVHSITKQVFTAVRVTPVVYRRSYLEWVPRTQGGGFRGEFPADTHEPVYNRLRDPETGVAKLENGNDLIETLSFFCLLHPEGGDPEPVIIAMAKTQTKAGKMWNQMQSRYVPPGAPARQYKRCAASYLLSTEIRRKDKNTWFVWKVGGAQVNPPEVAFMAQAFEQQVKGGAVIIDHGAQEAAADTSSDM